MSCSNDRLTSHFRDQVANAEPMFHVQDGVTVLLRGPVGTAFEDCCQSLQALLDDASLSQFSFVGTNNEPESTCLFVAVRPGDPDSAGGGNLQE